MDLIPDFVKRKHGEEKWDYLDARIAPILDPTYGIMVYQEQVMQVAQVVGGYSLGGADLLRRAMGKKKPEEMAQQREIFRAGAEKGGLADEKSMPLFDLMEKFAGYGFNKSHSAAYAWLAYQTAYLKAHHAAAFFAANLSAVMDDTDKVKPLVDDASNAHIRLLPPDINAGMYRFMPMNAAEVQYGLGAIKGTGEAAINNIVEARKASPFKDLADFCRRVDRRVVNKRAMEALIRAGAFDRLKAHRASLLASLAAAIELAEKAEADAQQVSLFGGAEEFASEALQLIDTPPWNTRDLLANEKAALGYYFSGHPFSAYRAEIRRIARTPLADIAPTPFKETTALGGVVESVRWVNGRRGRTAIITLDDGSAKVEVVAFGEACESARSALVADAPLVIEGRVQNDDFSGGLRVTAERIQTIDDIRGLRARALALSINGNANAKRLAQLLRPHVPGPHRVTINYTGPGGGAQFALGDQYRVRISEPLVQSLTEWLQDGNVEVVY
jgi:DNA polymerase-3 subunit alpha